MGSVLEGQSLCDVRQGKERKALTSDSLQSEDNDVAMHVFGVQVYEGLLS